MPLTFAFFSFSTPVEPFAALRFLSPLASFAWPLLLSRASTAFMFADDSAIASSLRALL